MPDAYSTSSAKSSSSPSSLALRAGSPAAWSRPMACLLYTSINISIKPIMQVLSLPISVITLGIFYLVVNTLMLYLSLIHI